jgi:ketosteroid isomerase-like protein
LSEYFSSFVVSGKIGIAQAAAYAAVSHSEESMLSSPTEVVRAFIAAINGRDSRQIAGLMTENHTFVDSLGRMESGREQMTAGWDEYFRLFPDYRIEVETLLAQGQIVAVFGSASGTYNGKRGLVPENRIEMPAAWRAVVQEGKVKHWQVYADWTVGTRTMAEDEKHG